MSAIQITAAAVSRTFSTADDCDIEHGVSRAAVAFAAVINRYSSRKVHSQLSTTGNGFRYGKI